MPAQSETRFDVDSSGLIDANRRPIRSVVLSGEAASSHWQDRQDASLPHYGANAEITDAALAQTYRLFEQYIIRQLHGRGRSRILDVGCGVNCDLPPYVRFLRDRDASEFGVYVGLDPIATEVERKYPFICARIENLPPATNARFDVFLFASSLDHFESVDVVADSVRKLASAGALVVVWIGLHDADLIAEFYMGRLARRHLSAGADLASLLRFAAATLLRLPKLIGHLWRRNRRLRRGQLLDQVHFHNYTKATIRGDLQRFGEIVDGPTYVGVDCFATVRVAG
jgi:SAM-dependent methyltransferase